MATSSAAAVSFSFATAGKISFGRGSVAGVGPALTALGVTKAMVGTHTAAPVSFFVWFYVYGFGVFVCVCVCCS